MRSAVIHILIALLIAVFAIGMPQPAQADCLECKDCTVSAPSQDHAPCPQGMMDCQIAQTCAGQWQKMSGHSTIGITCILADGTFGQDAATHIKSAYVPPETTPPRS